MVSEMLLGTIIIIYPETVFGILKHEFYKTYIKTRVRFAARLLQAGVPVNDECSYKFYKTNFLCYFF
jgi:hypothetical protein